MTHNKEELITMLWDEFQRWERMLARLTDEQITARELPAGLSIKDIVGHLHGWQVRSVARLEAAINQDKPVFELGPSGVNADDEEDLEKINAWIHAKYLDWPWKKVHLDWQMNYLRLLNLAETIPERDLLKAGKYEWLGDRALAEVLDGTYDHHHTEHYGPLMEALQKKGWLSSE